MTRGRSFASGKAGPAFDDIEAKAEARHMLERRIPGTSYVITDFGRWPLCGSAGLRKRADGALVAELEGSLK